MSFMMELTRFIEYCNAFYNIQYGVYPLWTADEIQRAVGEYLTNPHGIDIQFDSLDREAVREILEGSNFNH